jgi:hypothetical protein
MGLVSTSATTCMSWFSGRSQSPMNHTLPAKGDILVGGCQGDQYLPGGTDGRRAVISTLQLGNIEEACLCRLPSTAS